MIVLLSLAWAEPIDRIAALVNDEVICYSEIYEMGSDFLESSSMSKEGLEAAELEVLQALIDQELLAQEIKRLGLDVSEEEVEQALQDIARSNGIDRGDLQREVERTGMVWNTYLDQFKEQMRQMRFNQMVLQPRIEINEDALLDAYRRLTLEAPEALDLGAVFFAGAAQVRPAEEVAVALNISIEEAQAKLDELAKEQTADRDLKIQQFYSRLMVGEDFSIIAQDLDDGGFGANGGRMGLFAPGQLRPELNDVAIALEPETASDPICDDQGCLVLYLFGIQNMATGSFEELRPQLLDQYYTERFDQEMALWLEQTRRRAVVELKLSQPQ